MLPSRKAPFHRAEDDRILMAGEYTLGVFQPALEALDPDALARLQLDGMRRTLARVGRNAAWSRRLGGVRPEDVERPRTGRGCRSSPRTSCATPIRFALACGGAEGYRRVHMSSGTTGNPILNPYTAADVEQWGEVMARCYVAAGVTRDDVIQITPSFGLFTGGFGFHYGAERLGALIVPTGAGRTRLQLTLMRDLGVTVMPAIATYPLRLIEVAREEGFDLALAAAARRHPRLRDVVRRAARADRARAGDPDLRHHRHDGDGRPRARHRLRRARRHSRVGGSLPRRDRRPDDRRRRPDGDEGELVVSTLTRQGLPLVRYRTHDLTRIVRAPAARAGGRRCAWTACAAAPTTW